MIDAAHRPAATPGIGMYQPTFLYESLWDLGVMTLLLAADRRWRLDHARLFALYVAAYTAGRGWIEALRDDHANHIAGLRVNDWVSIIAFAAAVAYLVVARRSGRPAAQADDSPDDSVEPVPAHMGPPSDPPPSALGGR